jgi:hypothetical protein
MAARRSTAAARAAAQGTLDQGMVDLPQATAPATAPAASPEPGYLDSIEVLGKQLVAVQLVAPAEDQDDLRRVIAILRSVYRRERARGGSVL